MDRIHGELGPVGAMREIVSIQYLRAVAATMVVVHHVLHRVAPAETQADADFAVALWASGVDVFFVISGFIMWTTTAGRDLTPTAFWRARLVRIVPLYWVALAVYWVVLAVGGARAPRPGLEAVLSSATFVPYLDPGTRLVAPFLTPGWSLTHEMIFYALFGVALLARRPATRSAIVAFALFGLVAGRFVLGSQGPIAFRLTSPLGLEFLAGVVLAIGYARWGESRFAPRLGAVAAILAVGFVATVTAAHPSDWPRVVVFGVPATAVVLTALGFERVRGFDRLHPLKLLGDASYSLYLVHEIFLEVAAPATSGLPTAARAVLLFVGSIVAGLLVHRFVERPLTRLTTARRERPSVAEAVPVSSTP